MAKYKPIGDGTEGPVTTVKIEKPGGELSDFEKTPGVLDTGSPITYIPSSVVESLNLPIVDRMTVTGLDARPRSALVCEINLTMVDEEFARREFRGFRVCVWSGPSVLLGRNILRNFVLTFDGLNAQWRVESPQEHAHA